MYSAATRLSRGSIRRFSKRSRRHSTGSGATRCRALSISTTGRACRPMCSPMRSEGGLILGADEKVIERIKARERRMYELHRQGKRVTEIVRIIGEEFAVEVPETRVIHVLNRAMGGR